MCGLAPRSLSHVCHVTAALLSLLFHSRMRSSAGSSEPVASSSGLLSNVLGFFSREIESFVVNAAGGTVQASHARKHDREQVQHRILIHVPQQSPEPGPSGSSHKPKRVKKKSRRVNDAVYPSPPKRDKGPRKDERGRRPTTSERSRRPSEPGVFRTQNEPGKLGSSHSKQYTQFTYSFMQCSSNHLHRSRARRHPLNHLQSLCQVHYSRVRRPCYQTFSPCFKLHAYNACLTTRRRLSLNNPTQVETKSTQRWRTATPKPTSVQVCCFIDPMRMIIDPCLQKMFRRYPNSLRKRRGNRRLWIHRSVESLVKLRQSTRFEGRSGN